MFLERPELKARWGQQAINHSLPIEVSDVVCNWDTACNSYSASLDESASKTSAVALDKINISFKSGELTCVIGEVGSGKVGS